MILRHSRSFEALAIGDENDLKRKERHREKSQECRDWWFTAGLASAAQIYFKLHASATAAKPRMEWKLAYVVQGDRQLREPRFTPPSSLPIIHRSTIRTIPQHIRTRTVVHIDEGKTKAFSRLEKVALHTLDSAQSGQICSHGIMDCATAVAVK